MDYAALPLATDTEAETSIDLEKSLKELSKKAENTTNRRRSLFNVTVEKVKSPEEVRKSEDLKSAELRLKKEAKEWRDLYKQIKDDLKKAKQKPPVINVAILPEDKQRFLAQEPDMDRYLRSLHEFQCNAFRFAENEFIDKMELRKQITDLCNYKIQIAKQIRINKLHTSDDII